LSTVFSAGERERWESERGIAILGTHTLHTPPARYKPAAFRGQLLVNWSTIAQVLVDWSTSTGADEKEHWNSCWWTRALEQLLVNKSTNLAAGGQEW